LLDNTSDQSKISDKVEKILIKRKHQSRMQIPVDTENFPSFHESMVFNSSRKSTEVKKVKNIINNNFYQVYSGDPSQNYIDFFTKREIEPKVNFSSSFNNTSLDKTPSFIDELDNSQRNILNITNITQININDPKNVHKITITSTPRNPPPNNYFK
jgi:hypothetical protein